MKKSLLSLMLAASCAGAFAAGTPPPGLYRIDMDSTMSTAGNPTETRMVTQGANGDTAAQWRKGAETVARQYKGDKPVTVCIKPNAGTPLPPEATMGCTAQSTSKTADGLVATSSCPMGKITIAARQLDKERWEYLTDVAMVQGPVTGGPDGMARVLEHQVKHGASAAERAQAQQQLKEWKEARKEGDDARAAALAELQQELAAATDPGEKAALQQTLSGMAPGAPLMNARSRAVWTRIAGSCK